MKQTTLAPPCRPAGGAAARGFALIASLAVLLMLTLLALGMFRSFGLQERITGNTREKQHAFFAAQSALQSAESWLLSGNAIQAGTGTPSQGTPCSMSSPSPTPQICNTSTTPRQQTLATTVWNCEFGTMYTAPSTTQLTAQTTCAGGTPSTGSVYMIPQFAIGYLGADPTNLGAYLYQVTSLGYGGNQNAMAVVQSVYSVGASGANLGM
jgi:type IV pilus assembly protein PilX